MKIAYVEKVKSSRSLLFSINYTTARDAVAKAHRLQFPLSMCSPACIKAQLDNYHTKACKGGSQNLMRKRTAADKPEQDNGASD